MPPSYSRGQLSTWFTRRDFRVFKMVSLRKILFSRATNCKKTCQRKNYRRSRRLAESWPVGMMPPRMSRQSKWDKCLRVTILHRSMPNPAKACRKPWHTKWVALQLVNYPRLRRWISKTTLRNWTVKFLLWRSICLKIRTVKYPLSTDKINQAKWYTGQSKRRSNLARARPCHWMMTWRQ